MLRYFLLGCLLNSFILVHGQDLLNIEPFDNSFRSKKTYFKNPSLLVDKLTAEKFSEYEKFQSIFYWVINNIDYDYWSYLSKKSRRGSTVREILKHRVALCGDYANLMDTLCFMAGIQSIRVNGYAKDELFDVQDSIYISNHAWNIVRIDNSWYPYDITWSKGAMAWRYTRFSQWIVDQKMRLKYKVVEIQLKDRNKKYYRGITCNGSKEESDELEGKKVGYKYVYKRKIWKWILERFKIRVRLSYKESKSTDFFLADPSVFGITHAPEDPTFSLFTHRVVKDFEGDSNYYHLSSRDYELQKRTGSSCPECLGAAAGTPLEKALKLKYNSSSFNPKNKFTLAGCDYSIAIVKFEESWPLQDSAAKISLLDSSLFILDEAKTNLAKSAGTIRSEFDEQKQKNRKKYNILLDVTDIERRAIRVQMDRAFSETKDLRDLENSFGVDLRSYRYRRRSLKNLKRSSEILKELKKVQRSIDYLQEEKVINDRVVDSLNNLIDTTRHVFAALIPDLSKRIWQRVFEQDSLIAPHQRRLWFREEYLDDYKKPVVVESDSLRKRRVRYGEQVDSLVLKPAGICYNAGKRISDLVRERNRQRVAGYRIRRQLYQFKEISAMDFDSYTKMTELENMDDACWIKANAGDLPRVFAGFKTMILQHKHFEKNIRTERKIEGRRYTAIENELRRRCMRRLSVVSNNRRVTVLKAREIKKNKREFLKELRAQRRAERTARR